MNDRIEINAKNNRGEITGQKNDSSVKIQIDQNLIDLRNDYVLNTDQKAKSYFVWVRHLLTVNAGVIVLISALAKDFFVANVTCTGLLIVALIFLLLAFFKGVSALVGETQFYDTKCTEILNDIANQENDTKHVVKSTHHPIVRPIYAEYANKSLFCFSMGMVSIVLYVVVYSLIKLLEDMSICPGLYFVFALVSLVVAYFGVSSKIKQYGFDWTQLDRKRENI